MADSYTLREKSVFYVRNVKQFRESIPLCHDINDRACHRLLSWYLRNFAMSLIEATGAKLSIELQGFNLKGHQ